MRHSYLSAFLNFLIGGVMMSAAIALEILWLGLLFGTVIIGIIILLWRPLVLLFPFMIFAPYGWRRLLTSYYEFKPFKTKKVYEEIKDVIGNQIKAVHDFGGRVSIDKDTVAYISAMCMYSNHNPFIKLKNVSDIINLTFQDISYKNDIDVFFRNFSSFYYYAEFWEKVNEFTPIVSEEVNNKKGKYLIRTTDIPF